MPHVYIVTTGPGWKGTTSRRAVHHNRTGPSPMVTIGSFRDAGELHGDARLVAHVELQQHGREGLDRGGQRELPAVEGAHVRDIRDQVGRGLAGGREVGADQDVAL